MTLVELQELVEELYKRDDLIDPGIFIRIGDRQAPLSSIKVVPEDEIFNESIILQDSNYLDVLL